MKPEIIIALLLTLFFFIIPIHFFVMGEGYGYGIQGYTYRYQTTTQGVSLIPVSYEAEYIINGTITGKTANSILFWIIGSALYTIGLLVYLLTFDLGKRRYYKLSSLFIFCSLISVIISSILQYGPIFIGPAGVSILIGVPIIFGISWYVYNLPSENR